MSRFSWNEDPVTQKWVKTQTPLQGQGQRQLIAKAESPKIRRNLLLAEAACKYVGEAMRRGPGESNKSFSLLRRILPKMNLELEGLVKQRVPLGPIDPELENNITFVMKRQHYKGKLSEAGREMERLIEQQRNETVAPRNSQRAEIKKVGTYSEGGLSGWFLSEEHKTITRAKLVELSGVGNCGEQSLVAFKYLVTRRAPGIALVKWGQTVIPMNDRVGNRVGGNHTFVVIDMSPTVGKKSVASLAKAPQWGPNAVICDPWYREWFPVEGDDNRWRSKMSQILNLAKGIDPQNPLIKWDPNNVSAHFSGLWTFPRLAYLKEPQLEDVELARKPMSQDHLVRMEEIRSGAWPNSSKENPPVLEG